MSKESSNGKGLSPGDPKLTANIVDHLKRGGIFDKFRKDFLADIDTKVNLRSMF